MQSGALPTAAGVERALREVYARPEFAPPVQRWSFWRWMGELLEPVFRWIAETLGRFRGLGSSAPVLYWIVVVLLAALAAFLLVHLVRSSLGAMGGDGPAAPRPEGARAPRGVGDWEAEARRAAAEGRLRDASLALYRALLLRLDARGVIRFDPAKTPGDYRREAGRHPETARTLAAFLRGFEPVAFGGRPLDAEGYERLRSTAAEADARG
ncbi:MAG TPA: DUF4129 domain-containing protein [Longimicrobium sp.]|jgi:hypothetical protein